MAIAPSIFEEGNILELRFPIKGKHVGSPSNQQPAQTSRDLNNVRPFFDGRACGGQRPGLDKWGAGVQIAEVAGPVVAICSVSTAG